MSRPARVEITDLVRTWDVDGTRSPVLVAEVVDRLEAADQRRAAAVVRRMPARDGVLDDDALDDLVVRVHCELQRLTEELVMGRRVRDHLEPLVTGRGAEPVRVVDIGCGLGFTLRWLAAHAGWGRPGRAGRGRPRRDPGRRRASARDVRGTVLHLRGR